MLAASTAPSAAPAPTRVCNFVDEEDGPGVFDLFHDFLEALFELAADTWCRPPGAQVEREDALALEGLRHVVGDDALGETFDDGGLADARLADEGGVVLGAAGEDLDHALDLFRRGR